MRASRRIILDTLFHSRTIRLIQRRCSKIAEDNLDVYAIEMKAFIISGRQSSSQSNVVS